MKLIIVPHPDDEILMTGGVIHQAVLNNESIKVVIVTNGDYLADSTAYGERRINESITALKVMGVHEEDIEFFGYPDTGFEEEVSFLYNTFYNRTANIEMPIFSDTTYGTKVVKTYHFKHFGKEGTYTRSSIMQDLIYLLKEHQPDTIYTTYRYDAHYDHVGLSLYVREAIDRIGDYSPIVLEGLVHAHCGDQGWPNKASDCFDKPISFKKDWSERIIVPVSANTKALKRKAILCYQSQLHEDVKDYLLSFSKNEEVFFSVE